MRTTSTPVNGRHIVGYKLANLLVAFLSFHVRAFERTTMRTSTTVRGHCDGYN